MLVLIIILKPECFLGWTSLCEMTSIKVQTHSPIYLFTYTRMCVRRHVRAHTHTNTHIHSRILLNTGDISFLFKVFLTIPYLRSTIVIRRS